LLLAIEANSSSTWLVLRLRLGDVLRYCRYNALGFCTLGFLVLMYASFCSVLRTCFCIICDMLRTNLQYASMYTCFVPYTMKATLCYYFVLASKIIKLFFRWLTATWMHLYYMWHASNINIYFLEPTYVLFSRNKFLLGWKEKVGTFLSCKSEQILTEPKAKFLNVWPK
jgi:hypothetical protein